MISLEEFINNTKSLLNSPLRPKNWRDGQFIFNHIDVEYGVARHVQFVEGIDCFYDDSKIDSFLIASYNVLKQIEENK